MSRTCYVILCARCFRSGGTLINVGTKKQPLYVHAAGRCGPVDEKMRNKIMMERYGHLVGLILLNIGVDWDRSILYAEQS